MFNFKLISLLLALQNVRTIHTELSDKRLCVDPQCKEPISKARTLLKYHKPDPGVLSFDANVEVTIYSYSAGSNPDLWGAEVNGERGYVPKSLVREVRVFKKPGIVVDTDRPAVNVPSTDAIKPDAVKEPYEVVDGTTIYGGEGVPSGSNSETGAVLSDSSQETESVQDVADNSELAVDSDASNEQITADEAKSTLVEDFVAAVKDFMDENDDEENLDEAVSEENNVSEGTNENTSSAEVTKGSESSESVNSGVQHVENVETNAADETTVETQSNEQMLVHNVPDTKTYLNTTETSFTEPNPANEITENGNIVRETPQNVPEPQLPTDIPVVVDKLEEKSEIENVNQVLNSTEPPVVVVDTESSENVVNSQENINATEETVVTMEETATSDNLAPQPPILHETTTVSAVDDDPYIFNHEEVTQNPSAVTENSPPAVDYDQATQLPPAPEYKSEEPQQILPIVFEQPEPPEAPINSPNAEERQQTEAAFETESERSEEEKVDGVEEEPTGVFSGIYSYFGGSKRVEEEVHDHDSATTRVEFEQTEMPLTESGVEEANDDVLVSSRGSDEDSCPVNSSELRCKVNHESSILDKLYAMDFATLNYELIATLAITAATVLLFLLGSFFVDKTRQERPLIAKINDLQKQLHVTRTENEALVANGSQFETEKLENFVPRYEFDKLSDELEALRASKEEQIQTLEKELENSTEVGLELNRMLSEILSSQNGSETLIANVEQLQRQLIEQQATISSVNESLSVKDTEIHELNLELEISNKKVTELQAELDKTVLNLFRVEEEKDQQQSVLETELATMKRELDRLDERSKSELTQLHNENRLLKSQLTDTHRQLELKLNEFSLLKESVNEVNSIKNNSDTLKSLLDVNAIRAELTQLRKDNQGLTERLRQEQESKYAFEKQAEVGIQEAQRLRARLDEVDKEKLKAQTELQVLSNYFKEKEADLQKKLSKHEALWSEKQGEATSTVERIKFMQEELHNYKAQNESLKQEIVAQEVELKSQISLLEKKAHENWVSARQAERRLEDAKQEAAQLRNRLTLRERSFAEDKSINRIQSPLGQNGELIPSPLHHSSVESPASPPLLYGGRDHLTTSPPLPGLPPFLPPPPGVPFMPPPMPGVPPFMPPPPTMFPGDHRPPPLGRMSSPPPPMNSRYSPDSRAYSPYDRDSPPYGSDYGVPSPPPPMHRGYSPYNNEGREFKRPPNVRISSRNNKGSTLSSGSGNSNESLEKVSKHRGQV